MYIPENSLTDEIQELIEICRILEAEEGFKSKFEPPATEEEITEWENKNCIEIPDSYKDWLRFSQNAYILGYCPHFHMPKLENPPYDFTEDIVEIGTLSGVGVGLGFSSVTGKFITADHGELFEIDSFKEVLQNLVISHLKDFYEI